MNMNKIGSLAIVIAMIFSVIPALTIAPVAASDDYTLGIYGNANEDSTIDMRDVTKIARMICWLDTEVDLADAKYDENLNVLDIIQTELVILGREKELTLIDSADRTVTVEKPVERIIVLNSDAAEAVTVLKETEDVVGITDTVVKKSYYFPEMSEETVVGTWKEFDYEAIVSLSPDLVISYVSKVPGVEDNLEPFDIPVVALDFYKQATLTEEVEKLGYILNKVNEAEEYNDWCKEREDEVKNFVDGLTEEEKPTVFIEGTVKGLSDIATKGPGSASHDLCVMAGGKNIAADLDLVYPHVDWEWVRDENPEVIIKEKYTSPSWCWDNTDDPQELIDDIQGRPAVENLTAVQNDRVYACCSEPLYGMDSVVGLTYRAKLLHPAFDSDPKSVYSEYLDRFLGIEYPEDLIIVYPPF